MIRAPKRKYRCWKENGSVSQIPEINIRRWKKKNFWELDSNKKRYKIWKEDSTVMIPSTTQRRWEKNDNNKFYGEDDQIRTEDINDFQDNSYNIENVDCNYNCYGDNEDNTDNNKEEHDYEEIDCSNKNNGEYQQHGFIEENDFANINDADNGNGCDYDDADDDDSDNDSDDENEDNNINDTDKGNDFDYNDAGNDDSDNDFDDENEDNNINDADKGNDFDYNDAGNDDSDNDSDDENEYNNETDDEILNGDANGNEHSESDENDDNYEECSEDDIVYDDENENIDNSEEDENENNDDNGNDNLLNDDENENSDADEIEEIFKEVTEDCNKVMLYENSELSLDEAVFSVLEMWVKEKLTKEALKFQLKMLSDMLPNDNLMPKTLYQFFNYLEKQVVPIKIIKHYYCCNCSTYASTTLPQSCLQCQKMDFQYFFELDLIEQIKRLFETKNLAKIMNNPEITSDGNTNVIKDITCGSEYIRVNAGRNKYDITLILNTDGISLSKSSKSNCWPLMFSIAEVPPKIRNAYLVTVGLWYHTNLKPPMNLFLQPFCLKIKEFSDGIQWRDPISGNLNISAIKAPLFIADAPARAQIQNILNFNGTYGCNICEIKTKQCRNMSGNRNIRIYPYKANTVIRTGKNMELQAKKLENSNNVHEKGVKGFSIVSCLPLTDLGTCVIPEYMHSVLLGIGKQFLNIWLSKKGPWKLSKFVKQIDQFVTNIRPLQSTARMPRSITQYQSYKASELYQWILFYSIPTLKNILPHIYFQHWLLFVTSIYNLLQDKIEVIEINKTNESLHLFVKNIKFLYGEHEMTYNVHQLLHLCLCVKRWGPLWATSAFPFESYNGFLAKSAHGTKNLGQEIMNNMKISEGANVIKNKVMMQSRHDQTLMSSHNFKVLGRKINYDMSNFELDLILSAGLTPNSINFYSRCEINNNTYTSILYKTTKTNNTTVEVVCEDDVLLYGIISCFILESDHLYFILKILDVDNANILTQEDTLENVKHIIPVADNNKFKFIKFQDIQHISHPNV